MIYLLQVILISNTNKMNETIYGAKEVTSRALEISGCDNVHHVNIMDESLNLLGIAENNILTYVTADLRTLITE